MARSDRRNVTRYWWNRHVPGLSLLHADFAAHDYAPHVHDGFVIAITELGHATVRSRNVEEGLDPSVLFVSNPAELQSARMNGSLRWRYRSIYVAPPAIDVVLRGRGLTTMPHFTRNMIHDAELMDGFGRLHRALETDGDGLRQRELLITGFAALFRRHGSFAGRIADAPADRTIVSRVMALMQARHFESLQLDELANAVGLTGFQLIRLFKRTVGLTPHACLVQVRLNVARRCLRRGEPLAQSALAAGFCDQSALTKHFKRWYGITPRQFADAARLHRA